MSCDVLGWGRARTVCICHCGSAGPLTRRRPSVRVRSFNSPARRVHLYLNIVLRILTWSTLYTLKYYLINFCCAVSSDCWCAANLNLKYCGLTRSRRIDHSTTSVPNLGQVLSTGMQVRKETLFTCCAPAADFFFCFWFHLYTGACN